MVRGSSGIQLAKELAAQHAQEAAAAIGRLPPVAGEHASPSRQALLDICDRVLTRRK